MKDPSVKPVRCAIYTRVSTEQGLDQEFNSLDAQIGSAFVRDASDRIGPSGVLSGRCQGLPNRFANPMGARRNDDTYRLQGCNLARSIGALVFG